MFSMKEFKSLRIYLLIALSIWCILYSIFPSWAAFTRLLWYYGSSHTLGIFSSDANGWVLDLTLNGSTDTGVTIETDGTSLYLTGNFWVQTVGWWTFGDRWAGKTYLLVNPSGNIDDPMSLSWFAWTENAGWIRFNHDATQSWTGVTLSTANRTFTWLAWSETLGWIPFTSNGAFPSVIGTVKILWNAAEKKYILNLYGDIGNVYDIDITSSTINRIRKNVYLSIRNAPEGKINHTTSFWANWPNILNHMLVFTYTGTTMNSVNLSRIAPYIDDTIRGVLVIGGDIIVDQDLPNIPTALTRSLVSIKNDEWSGGNIFITSTVKKIYSSLFAEQSLYSGDRVGGVNNFYNDMLSKVIAYLPVRQLYIKWTLISRNTIGWAAKPESPRCPVVENNCNRTTALKYDINYFRNYDWTPANRATNGYDDYSIIVDYDSRVVDSPPPGL